MLELEELSRVGFGTYRVSTRFEEHRAALVYALEKGCTLVDTAPNYGDSQRLIGSVLAANRHLRSFVVTKAGYIQGRDLRLIDDLRSHGLRLDAVSTISGDSAHCIDPVFLNARVYECADTLGVKTIDSMLLHNPEHYFNDSGAITSAEEYYDRIERAFEFFEECVTTHRIRFYGISSNTFPDPTGRPETTELHVVLDIAKRVGGKDHHFRIIQFPLNLLERGAITPHHRDTSLIALARETGILTMTNRPFNAKGSNGLVRIAAKDTAQPSASELASAYEVMAAAIQRRLLTMGGGQTMRDFPVLRYLQDHWPNLGHPDAVEELFSNHMLPLVRALWPEDVPHNEQAECERMFEYGLAHAAGNLAREAMALRGEIVAEGLADAGDPRPMSAIACDTYLKWGASHVLVGMRSCIYVDDLSAFLQPARHQPTR